MPGLQVRDSVTLPHCGDVPGDAGRLTGLVPHLAPIARLYSVATGNKYPAAARFSDEIQAILHAPLKPEDISIRPNDGELYMTEMKYRLTLCRAFGPAGWSLIPLAEAKIQTLRVKQDFILCCHGQVVAKTTGQYTSTNGEKGLAMATENVKTAALVIACKILGIGGELRDREWCTVFRKKWCYQKIDDSHGRDVWCIRKLGLGSY
ncbi:hypothetical protein HK101_005795 [Irineochytrium annulatum]|nr:hypothetical protein HK101_005795 [Irineochytrium annulatum]